MKKVLSIILAVTLLALTCVFAVNAEENSRFTSEYNKKTGRVIYTDTETGERYEYLCDGVNSDGSEFIIVDHLCSLNCEIFYKMLGRVRVKNHDMESAAPYDYATTYYAIKGNQIENIYDAYEKGMIEDTAFYEAMVNSEYSRWVEWIEDENKDTDDNKTFRYKDVFMDTYFGEEYWDGSEPSYDPIYVYDELSYYDNDDGNWGLLYIEADCYTDQILQLVLFDRYIELMRGCSPFELGYCVYDEAENAFIDVRKAAKDEKYDSELKKYFNDNNIGKLIGDIDGDGRLTVADATVIQKCQVGLSVYPDNDYIGHYVRSSEDDSVLKYLSDINRDGKRNVADATAILKFVVGLDF